MYGVIWGILQGIASLFFDVGFKDAGFYILIGLSISLFYLGSLFRKNNP